MSKPATSAFKLPDEFSGLTGPAKESFESMSRAYSDWLQNANRVQAELIRFLGERFHKDVSLVSRFASCRKPEEFLKLQSDAMSEISNDYMQAGTRLLQLFGEASKDTIGKFASTRSGSRRAS